MYFSRAPDIWIIRVKHIYDIIRDIVNIVRHFIRIFTANLSIFGAQFGVFCKVQFHENHSRRNER